MAKWILPLFLVLAMWPLPVQADEYDVAGTASPDGRYAFRWLPKKGGVQLCLIEVRSRRALVGLEEWPSAPTHSYPYITVRWSEGSEVVGFVRQMRKFAEIGTIRIGKKAELRWQPDDWDKTLVRRARPIRWPWAKESIDGSSAKPVSINARGEFIVEGTVEMIGKDNTMVECWKTLRLVPDRKGGLAVEFGR